MLHLAPRGRDGDKNIPVVVNLDPFVHQHFLPLVEVIRTRNLVAGRKGLCNNAMMRVLDLVHLELSEGVEDNSGLDQQGFGNGFCAGVATEGDLFTELVDGLKLLSGEHALWSKGMNYLVDSSESVAVDWGSANGTD
jgi:pyruvate/2-oxoacid:ferredoxin oxidoreductase alpha subunit